MRKCFYLLRKNDTIRRIALYHFYYLLLIIFILFVDLLILAVMRESGCFILFEKLIFSFYDKLIINLLIESKYGESS